MNEAYHLLSYKTKQKTLLAIKLVATGNTNINMTITYIQVDVNPHN